VTYTALFTLPTTAVADITTYMTNVFTDFWVLLAVAIGIPVGFAVANKLISLVTKHVRG
jgi:hypothetical protein